MERKSLQKELTSLLYKFKQGESRNGRCPLSSNHYFKNTNCSLKRWNWDTKGQNINIWDILSFALRKTKWQWGILELRQNWVVKCMFLNFSLKFELEIYKWNNPWKCLKMIQTNNLLINVTGIKYVIFLQISLKCISCISWSYTSLKAFNRSSFVHKLENVRLLSTIVKLFES